MTTEHEQLEQIIEAALFTAGEPMNTTRIQYLFEESERPTVEAIKQVIETLEKKYEGHGIMLVKVASGYRFQSRKEYAPWLQRMFESKPPRYSRALLETLALIAYKQPITRGEVEDIRGVSTSNHVVKILLEREWIKIVGQKEVPGRPALYGTTKQFLDYFNLNGLSELPKLKDIVDLDAMGEKISRQLALAIEGKASNDVPDTVIEMTVKSLDAESESEEVN
ncbi:MAG TPA: SMC-Scp complex subunit ScpB [Coxiellaceae bacterium]|nr:SMC-Scp complex subunit ScpB [Coxiellaceae bacterium]